MGPNARDGWLWPAELGHQGLPYGATLALAKRLCRTADRIYPPRMFGSLDHNRGGASAPRVSRLR
jgi:hypothetical protein